MKRLKSLWTFIRHPIKSLNRRSVLKRLKNRIEGKTTESILELLLEAMSLMFYLDKDYRKNIVGFEGAYQIQDRDGGVDVGVKFENDKMKVKKRGVENANIEVTFKDAESINSFLFSQNPDILDFVLHNKVTYNGNLNYLLKFAYMAKHLQLQFVP